MNAKQIDGKTTHDSVFIRTQLDLFFDIHIVLHKQRYRSAASRATSLSRNLYKLASNTPCAAEVIRLTTYSSDQAEPDHGG